MLIESIGEQPFPDRRGRAFEIHVDEQVSQLFIGFLDVPEVAGGRLKVELDIKTLAGEHLSAIPQWRQSREGAPARLVSLHRTAPAFELPKIALPNNVYRKITINVRARKRDLTVMRDSATKFYVTGRLTNGGLATSLVRSLA